jgi:hypothetical protein
MSSFAWDPTTGVLNVYGDAGNNTFTVSQVSPTSPDVRVTVDNQFFQSNFVTFISVFGYDGNDSLTVYTRNGLNPNIYFDGGSGFDTLSLPGTDENPVLRVPGPASTNLSWWDRPARTVSFQNVESLDNAGIATSMANAAFVDHAFRDLLHRDIDFGSLRAWTNQLNLRQSQGWSPLDARKEVVSGIDHSTEYRQNLVATYYRALLRREVDPNGMQNFVGLMTTQGRTDEQVIAALVGSDEYYVRSGATSTNFQPFLQALHADLLTGPLDPASQQGWGSFLSQYGNTVTNRTQVALSALGGQEYRQHLVAGAAGSPITRGYFPTYLHRAAEDTAV